MLHSVIVSPARQQAMSSHTRSDRRDILSAASLSATIFPLKSPLRNQDLFERMFCLSDRCFSATWQHFPQVREAPGFVANEGQADLAYSGLLFEGLKGERKFPRRIGHDSATVDGRDPAPGAQCPMRVSIAN